MAPCFGCVGEPSWFQTWANGLMVILIDRASIRAAVRTDFFRLKPGLSFRFCIPGCPLHLFIAKNFPIGEAGVFPFWNAFHMADMLGGFGFRSWSCHGRPQSCRWVASALRHGTMALEAMFMTILLVSVQVQRPSRDYNCLVRPPRAPTALGVPDWAAGNCSIT